MTNNQFLTTQEIARQSLLVLRENLVFPMLSYRDCADDFAKKGDTIQVKKPPVYEANEFDGSITVQDTVEDSVLVSLDKIADVSVEITAKEMALNLESFTDQVITPAAVAIAEKINRDGLKLYKDIPYVAGTAGSTPQSLEAFATVRKMLNINKAPAAARAAIWDPEADYKFSTLDTVVHAEKAGSTDALREGSIGRIQGLDNYMSQAVPQHQKGSLAVTSGDIKLKNAAEAGATALVLNGSGLSGSLVKGDLLQIEGQTYTVMAAASVVENQAEVVIYPALRAAAEVASVVKIIDNHRANLAFHKNAFAFVTRPLEVARGVESYVTNFEGLTLRVTFSYDATHKKQMLSIDTLYGFKTLYPELAVRVLG